MYRLYRNATLVLGFLILMAWAIWPPQEKLRLGKDLSGGVSLVYSVQIRSDENEKEVLNNTIAVLKDRVDPNGLMEISMVAQGRDRIEITMPLPRPEVKALREAYEQELAKLGEFQISRSSLDEALRRTGDDRAARLRELSGKDESRFQRLTSIAMAYDAAQSLRAQAEAAKAQPPAGVSLDDLYAQAAKAEIDLENEINKLMGEAVPPAMLRRALLLPNTSKSVFDSKTNERHTLPSAQGKALDELFAAHPARKADIERAIESYKKYSAARKAFDDPQDLIRLLKGAGVLSFRITVDEGSHPEIERLRQELRERGPHNVRSADARWYKVNQIANWFDSVGQAKLLEENPREFFRSLGYVGEEHAGEYYILCWDTRGTRLTPAEGQWQVAAAFEGPRDERGRPTIGFEMNPKGASLLGDLTKNHVQKRMAVLLDDEVYTAPTLESAISKSGRITGDFTPAERTYIIKVLAGGSLQAKLSPEPISVQTLSPELGADRLQDGLKTGLICFVVVSIFMVVYYFQCGLIAVVALLANAIVILGVMALNKAAFTMPGIAGIVLTFGQAIDSNVLIYERMREEFNRGHDMKTAVRLGFSRAFASIVDGNVANLIICVVLAFAGTPEIRGFAITLGIGVVATLFSALTLSRLIFTIFVDHIGWRHTSMLPMAWPALQRWLTWNVDWLKWRYAFWTFAIVASVGGLALGVWRGPAMLDTEFRGGTEVTLRFKENPEGTGRITMTREQVLERVREVGRAGSFEPETRLALASAEVGVINPRADQVTSDTFSVKMPAINSQVVLDALVGAFADVIETRPALTFTGQDAADWRHAPVHRITARTLGDSIGRPGLTDDVSPYFGGAAIVLDNLPPGVTRAGLLSRLQEVRRSAASAAMIARPLDVRVIEGTEDNVKSAAVLVVDQGTTFFENEERWNSAVAAAEWAFLLEAVGGRTQLASVNNFSPTIANTFKAQAIVSVLLSMLLLAIYVWARYGTLRWALAATLPLFHDVLAVIGCLALAQLAYEHPSTHAWAAKLGLMSFKIDLNMIAALLTIAGFSLNDTIIILDRIRENKGKAAYASYEAVNDAINQTISRTIITAGTTLFSTVTLYLFGGEAVRGFAFAFNLGVFVGVFSSIAVSAPLVWSRARTAPRRATTSENARPAELVAGGA